MGKFGLLANKCKTNFQSIFYSMSFRNLKALLAGINIATLLGLGANTYVLRSHMVELSEDHEARMVQTQNTSLNTCLVYLSILNAGVSTGRAGRDITRAYWVDRGGFGS